MPTLDSDEQVTDTTPKILTQKEFADKIRAKIPALKDLTDLQIVTEITKRRPDVASRIQNANPTPGSPMAGDAQAAAAQAKAEDKSTYGIKLLRATLSALPAAGAAAGYALAPESMGLSIPVGAAAGKAAQNFGNQYLGDKTTIPGTLWDATKEGAITAAMPNAIELGGNAAKSLWGGTVIPDLKRAGASVVSDTGNMASSILPNKWQWLAKSPLMDKLRATANSSSGFDPLVRQTWRDIPEKLGEIVEGSIPKGGASEGVFSEYQKTLPPHVQEQLGPRVFQQGQATAAGAGNYPRPNIPEFDPINAPTVEPTAAKTPNVEDLGYKLKKATEAAKSGVQPGAMDTSSIKFAGKTGSEGVSPEAATKPKIKLNNNGTFHVLDKSGNAIITIDPNNPLSQEAIEALKAFSKQ